MSAVIANITIASLIWAAPFVGLGVYWMHRARHENDLGALGFVRIVVRTGVLLLFLGSIGFLVIFQNQPGPDAGLVTSVGLAFSLVGATIVWAVSLLVAFLVLRATPVRQRDTI